LTASKAFNPRQIEIGHMVRETNRNYTLRNFGFHCAECDKHFWFASTTFQVKKPSSVLLVPYEGEWVLWRQPETKSFHPLTLSTDWDESRSPREARTKHRKGVTFLVGGDKWLHPSRAIILGR
jgi:hypothetical protein